MRRDIAARSYQCIAALALSAGSLGAQDASISFGDQVTLRVTSSDSGRVARFAVVGAGLSFTRASSELVLGDTVYFYTPAQVTIRMYTKSATISALPGEPNLQVAVEHPLASASDPFFVGRLFEVHRREPSSALTLPRR